MARTDGPLSDFETGRILYELALYRCSWCALVLVRPGPFLQPELHAGCAGYWAAVSPGEPRAPRMLLLRMLSREMLGSRRGAP